MNEYERLLARNTNPPTTQCLLSNAHAPHEWWYTSSGGGHMLYTIDASDLNCEKGLKKHKCPGLSGWTSDHMM